MILVVPFSKVDHLSVTLTTFHFSLHFLSSLNCYFLISVASWLWLLIGNPGILESTGEYVL